MILKKIMINSIIVTMQCYTLDIYYVNLHLEIMDLCNEKHVNTND